jgi:hypothetical protein
VSTSADETAVDPEGAAGTGEAWQDQALGVVHAGDRYEFGYGSDYYGIWDKQSTAKPLERFPATDEGRAAGWERYLRLEPGADGAQTGPSVPDWIANPPHKSKGRAKWVWLGAAAVLIGGIIVLVVIRSGGGGGGGGGNAQAGSGSKATIDVTAPSPVSGDLTGTTFDPQGFDTLGPTVDAVWENANARLTIHLENPKVGETPTKENPLAEVVIQTVGQPEFDSRHGECTLTITQVDAENLAGSFSCTGVPSSGSSETLDATGTFQATTG